MTCFGYKTFSVQDPHAHDIKLNSFKTSVARYYNNITEFNNK